MDAGMRFRVNAPQVVHQTLDGEVVLIQLASGIYYSLRGAAAEVFGRLERGDSLGDVVAGTVAHREGGPAGVEAAIRRFAEELAAEGLIVAVEDEGGALGPVPSDREPAALTLGPLGPLGPLTIERYDDLRDLVLLDPIHEVAESAGWPRRAGDATRP